MSLTQKLPPDLRASCERGLQVVFQNPFATDARASMVDYARVAHSATRREIGEGVAARSSALVDEALAGGRTLSDYAEDDAERILILALHEAYTTLVDPLDVLIDRGGEGELPGWWKAFARTEFDAETATGFVAVFYQFRRGFRFLSERIAGDGPAMTELRFQCWQTLFGADIRWYVRRLWGRLDDCPVLLTGETGVGKSRIARLLGESGFIPFEADRGLSGGGRGRFAYTFKEAMVPVVIPEYPGTLIESALFGHAKGAFTGAERSRPGVFERCRKNGIAFLDEIGDIAPEVQTKLLRVLQEREFSPVGSSEVHAFQGRVVSATHHDLSTLRKEGRFREDLYYRLCSVELEIPSLRKRIAESASELPRLVGEVISKWVGEYDAALVDEVVQMLGKSLPKDYRWPGNIRELEQAVRRCCLVGSYDGDPLHTKGAVAASFNFSSSTAQSAKELLRGYCRYLYAETGKYSEVASVTQLDRRTVRAYIVETEE